MSVLSSLAAVVVGAQPAREITIAAGGDVMIGRIEDNDFVASEESDPLSAIRAELSGADLAIVNLETALCELSPDPGPRPTFSSPLETASALAEAGIDVVSLANNHSLDCGVAGLSATIDALRAVGIVPAGAAVDSSPLRPVLLDVDGVSIAVLAATLILPNHCLAESDSQTECARPVAYVRFEDAVSLLPVRIRTARQSLGADFVVVSVHWGVEGAAVPSPRQRELAHLLVAAGADLVLGHHPHVVQEVERYGKSQVAYSLGDLVGGSAETTGGLMVFSLP